MFTNFSKAERAVHFPSDRRRFIGVKPAVIIVVIILLLATVGMAWLQYLVFGLPPDPSASFPSLTASDPSGFPWWLRISHWVTFFFLALIIRSGLSILTFHTGRSRSLVLE